METVDNSVTQEVDPLNMPAGEVPPRTFPLLVEKLHGFVVASADIQPTKTEGVSMVKICLKTTADGVSTDGDVISAGFPVFTNWIFTPTGNLTAQMIKEQGAEILRACGLPTAKVSDLRDNPSIIVDKVVCIKTRNRKAKDGFDAQTEVARGGWITPKS